MREKEKMVSGKFYNPSESELFYDRINAKTICQK